MEKIVKTADGGTVIVTGTVDEDVAVKLAEGMALFAKLAAMPAPKKEEK